MKKIYQLTAFCLVLLCAMVTCGGCNRNALISSNEIIVTGTDGKEYDSYEAACQAQDYEAAHKYLIAMKKAGSSDYDLAREFVFSQEALYLISMNDTTSTKRLFFLLQEDAYEVDSHILDARCNTIIELAIKQNNQILVEQTIGQYNNLIDAPVLRKIYEYIYKEGRNSDTNAMMELLFKNNGIDIMVDDAITLQNDALLIQIIAKCSEKDLNASTKIIKYFSEKKDKKQITNITTILQKNMQWEALMELATVTNNMVLMRQVYQKTDNKDKIFDLMVQHAAMNKSASEMQNILPLVTNSSYAEKVIKKCMEADMPNIITTLAKRLCSQFSESFLDDIMKYALTKDGSEFTNLVISILNGTSIEGHPLSAGERMTSDRPSSVVHSHNNYVSSVKAFNSKCDKVLDSAISQHKSQLAQKVVTLYREVPNEYIVNEHWWEIAKTCKYSNEMKLRAQERIKEAKMRGDI